MLSIGAWSRTVLLELVDHVIEIGIACPEAPSESVSATRGDSLAVRDHVELPRLAGPGHGFDFKALLDEGHETRDLGWLFCHVGQYTISIFILLSKLSGVAT